MQNLDILKGNEKALREGAHGLRVKLLALKENCRHPRAFLDYSPQRTRCAACDKMLWSATGDKHWSNQANLSADELQDISKTHSRLKHDLKSMETAIKNLEALCPHPDSPIE